MPNKTKLVRLGSLSCDYYATYGRAIVEQQFSGAKFLPGYQRTVLVFEGIGDFDVFAVVNRDDTDKKTSRLRLVDES